MNRKKDDPYGPSWYCLFSVHFLEFLLIFTQFSLVGKYEVTRTDLSQDRLFAGEVTLGLIVDDKLLGLIDLRVRHRYSLQK